MAGWFDTYQNEIVRKTDNGKISYDSIATREISNSLVYGDYTQRDTTKLDTTEVYLKALDLSKKKLTPELKQVIDDLTIAELNNVIGLTQYVQKTPLGFAIDAIHLEAVQYLLSLGVDTSIFGPNQKHILQELLASNATNNRIQILEMILDKFSGFIPLEQNYNGSYYSEKYLVILINKNVISREDLLLAYDEFKPTRKRNLIAKCPIMTEIVLEKQDEPFYPDDIKEMFFF